MPTLIIVNKVGVFVMKKCTALVVLLSVAQLTFAQFNEEEQAAYNQLSDDDKVAVLHLLQGIEHYENAQYPEALDELDKVKNIIPDMPEAYYVSFWVYYRLHNVSSALNELQKLSSIDKSVKDSPRYIYHLATAYGLLNDMVKKREYWQKIVDLDVELTIENILMKADAYNGLGDYEKSLDLFKNAETRIDEHTEKGLRGPVYWSIGHASIMLKDYETAIAYFNESLNYKPSAQSYDSLGTAYRKNNDYQKAIKHYKLALKKDSLLDNAWAGLGRTYRAMGNFDKAKKHLEKGLEVNPLHHQSRQHLIHVLIDLGNIEEAKNHIKILQEQTLPDETWQKRISKCLARIENI